MDILETGETISSETETLKQNFNDYDFFYFHVKKTDSYGEDGNFKDKVKVIEETDSQIPEILELKPDVILVTGDHSTPFSLASHSWHPVPTLLWSKNARTDKVEKFGERACLSGALGPRMPATDLIPLALANALRLEKFGA
jgi:2,3-bisphosphoglycerate-independent phosphoglycerate mutase